MLTKPELEAIRERAKKPTVIMLTKPEELEAIRERAKKATVVMLTKPELEAIRERAEKATAGPWRMYHPQSGYYYVGNHIEDLPVCLMNGDPNQRGDDAWFVALARTDIPALLQHIEGLETQLAEAQALVERLVRAIR